MLHYTSYHAEADFSFGDIRIFFPHVIAEYFFVVIKLPSRETNLVGSRTILFIAGIGMLISIILA